MVNFKPLYSAFTLDTIIQVAFGVSAPLDSLADETNQIVTMAKRLFQQELSLKLIPLYAFLFMFPRLAHALNLRVNGDVTDYFTAFSMEIIKQKREELGGKSVPGDSKKSAKADNFIELLLEAERESEQSAADSQPTLASKETGQTKLAKCKCFLFF